jgi:hypothetical protein
VNANGVVSGAGSDCATSGSLIPGALYDLLFSHGDGTAAVDTGRATYNASSGVLTVPETDTGDGTHAGQVDFGTGTEYGVQSGKASWAGLPSGQTGLVAHLPAAPCSGLLNFTNVAGDMTSNCVASSGNGAFTSTVKPEAGDYTVTAADFSTSGALTNLRYSIPYAHGVYYNTFTLPASGLPPADTSCIEISNANATPLLVVNGPGTTLEGSAQTLVAWRAHGAILCYNASGSDYNIVSGDLDTPLTVLDIGPNGTAGVQLAVVADQTTGYSFVVPRPGLKLTGINVPSFGADNNSDNAAGILDIPSINGGYGG